MIKANKIYSVKEIFLTLQGEGYNMGTSSVFCRFSGCNLWNGLEKDRKRQRLKSKNLDTFQERGNLSKDSFETMVPGLSEARRKRRKEESIPPQSQKEKQEITNLVEDESILFGEE